jgi:hypothetical protein
MHSMRQYDNIAEFGDVSNEFFNISEKKEMFSDNRKRQLSFLFLSSTEKSFKEYVSNFADFNLRRLKSFNNCWSFFATSNRDPSFLVILSTLRTDDCEMFDTDC